MDDVVLCPICGDKMRVSHLNNKFLYPVDKTSDYTERVCAANHNHVVNLWADKATNQVDYLRFSLNKEYSRWMEIDYVNQKSRITLRMGTDYQYINIPRLLLPDFPDLVAMRDQIGLFLTFS
jgi:hypothetical protein